MHGSFWNLKMVKVKNNNISKPVDFSCKTKNSKQKDRYPLY